MKFTTKLLVLAIAGTTAMPVAAAPAPAGKWQVTFEPYFMAPAMDGKTAIAIFDVPVSSSPSDIFRNLNWGAMGLLEINNGKFGLAVDATYMNLETVRSGLVDTIGGHQGAYTAMALVRIDPHAELYAGARVNDIGLRLSGTGPLGNPRAAARSVTWVDPVIGLRVNLPVSRTTDLTVVMDAGGLGGDSDVTVQAWPALGFRLSDSLRAKVGYRLIYTRYETGAGLNRFVYDVLTYGPTVGLQFKF